MSANSSTQATLQSRRSLYVGGLAETVKEINLRAAMIPFGPLKSIDIPMDYAKGTHKGFAFVEYQDADDAAEAIYNMDGAELFGRVLNVNLAQNNQVNLGSNKAVWTTDEWFQQQNGEEANANKDAKVDIEALKEDGVSKSI
jgi:peptidyl-prolyl isomerase E (cyclophilin E)